MVESTHCLVLGESTVTKTFTLRHGDEEEREWTGLSLLDRWAPGLAPRPLHRGETPGVVSVTMSRVPGLPLAGATLTGARLEGVLDALLRMRDVVPPEVLDTLPTRRGGPTELPVALRAWLPPTTRYAGRGGHRSPGGRDDLAHRRARPRRARIRGRPDAGPRRREPG